MIEKIVIPSSHNYQNTEIESREHKSLHEKPIRDLVESAVFDEVKRRIHCNNDETALSILIVAKERVKQDLSRYTNAAKIVLFALKPFFLIAAIDLLNQSPVNI